MAAILPMMPGSLSGELVDAASLAALAGMGARLPVDLSSFWGFEVQLGNDRPEIDFLVEIRRGTPGHALLAGREASRLDDLCGRSEAWAELRRFARAWFDSGHALHGAVRNVWVEFDMVAARAAHADALARPCVFWGPAPPASGDQVAVGDLLDLVRREFSPCPDALPRDLLGEAVRALPGAARIFQIGAMHWRGDVVLRMCVNTIARDDVPGWLERLKWDGDAPALGAALASIAPLVRNIAVDVDFTPQGVGRKIGIECYLDWRELAVPEWDRVLDYLSARGLCSASKRRAVTAFPAKTEYSLREQLAARRRGFMFPVLYRNIHHVKLAFVGSGWVEAKAYLGVSRPGIDIAACFSPEPSDGGESSWYMP